MLSWRQASVEHERMPVLKACKVGAEISADARYGAAVHGVDVDGSLIEYRPLS